MIEMWTSDLMIWRDGALARNAPRALVGDGSRDAMRGGLQALRGDRKARDAFVAGDGRRRAGAHRVQERKQLGPQRLVMSDRQMAHRVAAVRLEAETFGHLTREEIACDVLAAGRDRD